MGPDAYVVAGVFFGLLFYELTGVSPGGVIVPGYIALGVASPGSAALTIAVSFATLGVVRLASRFLLLYGRRRYALYVMTAMALGAIAHAALPALSPSLGGIRAIGWLVPGIIASDMDRQGAAKTLLALAAVTAIAYVAGTLWP